MQGMVGHLQVFVLSDWLSVNQPIKFSATAKGLRWLIPHQKLPWKHDSVSDWPNHIYLKEEKLANKFNTISLNKTANYQINSCLGNIYCPRLQNIEQKPGWLQGKYNISLKKAPYGLPLDTKEYFIYFLVSIYNLNYAGIVCTCIFYRNLLLWLKNLSCREERRCLLAMSSREWRIIKGSYIITFGFGVCILEYSLPLCKDLFQNYNRLSGLFLMQVARLREELVLARGGRWRFSHGTYSGVTFPEMENRNTSSRDTISSPVRDISSDSRITLHLSVISICNKR